MAQTFYKVATPGLWIGGAVYLCTYFFPTVPTMFIPRFILCPTSFLVFSCHCLSFSVFSANRSSTGSPLCRLLVVIHPRSFIPQLTSKNIHMLYYLLLLLACNWFTHYYRLLIRLSHSDKSTTTTLNVSVKLRVSNLIDWIYFLPGLLFIIFSYFGSFMVVWGLGF